MIGRIAALRNAPTRGEMLPVIVYQVIQLLHADGAALLMHDPATDQSVIVLAGGSWTALTGTRLRRGQGVVGQMIAAGQPTVGRVSQADPWATRPGLFQIWQVVPGMPLIEQGQTIGAIWIGRQTDLSSDELRLLHVICEITANALYRARVLEMLEDRVAERTRELAEAKNTFTLPAIRLSVCQPQKRSAAPMGIGGMIIGTGSAGPYR